MVRNGRYIAVTGAAAGAALLVADLHTPQRWYNMLRIFRPTSPMSIGTCILSGFAGFSGLAALAQFFSRPHRRWTRRLARAAEVPAALTGAGMTFYTGALLAATSTPLWAAGPRLLSARFACSAMATAAAALSLAENADSANNAAALDRLAALSSAAGSVLSAAAHANEGRQGLARAADMDAGTASEDALARHLGHTLPLACYCLGALLPARRQTFSRVAALGVLAGGLLMRAAIFRAGNQSAREPREYLSLTQAATDDRGR
jgi:formate-dependent nitrite reductase membrane component NrfD